MVFKLGEGVEENKVNIHKKGMKKYVLGTCLRKIQRIRNQWELFLERGAEIIKKNRLGFNCTFYYFPKAKWCFKIVR